MKTDKYNIKSTRAYIFDYGGTLDTGGYHWSDAIWQAYQDVGVPVCESAFREAYVAVERRLGAEPFISPDFSFRQTLELKLQLQMQQMDCIPFVPAVLERLYAQTLTHTSHSREVLRRLALEKPLALVSNFYGNLTTVLREMQLDDLFCCVVESATVGVRKPDSRIFELALQILRLPAEQVAVVGDSWKNDIQPAASLGCTTVWLQPAQGMAPIVPDATFVINDLDELL